MRILIVDDSRMNIKIAEDCLIAYHAAEELSSSLSGEEALEFMENHHVDLVLLDIVMPGLSGIDVLRRLRKNQRLDTTKVIMLTTVEDSMVLKECFELGATDYVQKPFDTVEFVARIKSVLAELNSEKKLIKALELLERQNVELQKVNQMLKDAQNYLVEKEKMTAVGKLVGGLTKEIKAPLAQLDYKVQRAMQKVDSLDGTMDLYNMKINMKDDFQGCLDEIEQMHKLLRTLGHYSQDTHKDPKGPVRLSEIVEEVLMLLKNELRFVSTVETHFGDPSLLICSKDLVRNALMNIVTNAIDALKDIPQGKLSLRTIETDDAVLCAVTDNGPGVEDFIKERIFEPFFTTKSKSEHVGIGLSYAYDAIVEKQGGQLVFESVAGRGTTFTIVLKK